MIRNGAIAVVMMAALGLAVAFLSGSLSPGGTIANEVTESTGDAYLCGTSTLVNDPYVDIDKVNIRQVTGGWEVTVSMGPSMVTIFDESFSAAVEVRLGLQVGLYQIHDGTPTIDNATISPEAVIFFFEVLLPEEIDLKVDSFHKALEQDPTSCDTAFLGDATAGKITPTASPTATEEATKTPLTPTGTAELGTTTPTPSNTTTPGTPTGTPTDTDTPTPSDTPQTPSVTPPTVTPEPPGTTPTPTTTPELVKVTILKEDADAPPFSDFHHFLEDWEMKVFDGNGCTGSPIASGFTSGEIDPDVIPDYSLLLPPGIYSVAETQQPGWERVRPILFCQNFTVSLEPVELSFSNRRISNGDVNKDGITNSLDALVVLQFIAGLVSDLGRNSERADVNDDGIVNAVDTALMLQFEAGLIDSLPVPPPGG